MEEMGSNIQLPKLLNKTTFFGFSSVGLTHLEGGGKVAIGEIRNFAQSFR